MNPVAIIPARGGSKRLPRKNAMLLRGRPILSYPVRAALESGLFSEVLVSTEDDEIAALSQRAGARVVERRADLATDDATVAEVCLHALDELRASPETFCCIYATAAFITATDLRESAELLRSADFVMGVSEYELHPYRALVEQDGRLVPAWPVEAKIQRALPRMVASNGTLYWARVAAFRAVRDFYGEDLVGYELPPERAVDIDTPEDFERAVRLADLAGL